MKISSFLASWGGGLGNAAIDENTLRFPYKAVFLDRLNRKNIGARATGKALYQMCCEIGIETVHTFDIDIFNGFDLSKTVDDIAKDIVKQGSKRQNGEVLSNLLASFQNANMLIVNGEGSFIFHKHGCSTMRAILALMKIAQKSGCRTCLVNTEAAPDVSGNFDKTLLSDIKPSMKYIDLFVVRSERSLKFAQKYLSEKVVWRPDALFSWIKYFDRGLEKPRIGESIVPFPDSIFDFDKFDFSKPYICISDSSILDGSNRRFNVELCENVHIHYRNLRLVLC